MHRRMPRLQVAVTAQAEEGSPRTGGGVADDLSRGRSACALLGLGWTLETFHSAPPCPQGETEEP